MATEEPTVAPPVGKPLAAAPIAMPLNSEQFFAVGAATAGTSPPPPQAAASSAVVTVTAAIRDWYIEVDFILSPSKFFYFVMQVVALSTFVGNDSEKVGTAPHSFSMRRSFEKCGLRMPASLCAISGNSRGDSVLELRQLKYFVGIVEAGSVSRASALLHVAQPALSAQIARLEDELGARLLTRSVRGVTPTAAGEVVYEQAGLILKQVEATQAIAAQADQGPSGSVAVGLPWSVASVIGLGLLQKTKASMPAVRLNIT